MKKLFLIYCLFIIPSFVKAQNTTLDVVYLEHLKWQPKNKEKYSKEETALLIEAMNEKRPFLLTLNTNESVYRPIPKINNNEPTDGTSISFSSSSTYIFKDIKNNIYLSEESYPKKFIIKDSLQKFNWQILNETKKILGYFSKKATTTFDNYECIAWFAPDIEIKNGPDEFWGLPGLILNLEIKHKKADEIRIIEVESISKSQSPSILQETAKKKKGKTISKNEFQKIFDDFVKKEDEMLGGGVDTD